MRVIDETGKQIGIVSREEAFRIAQEKGLDLVEIVPDVDPPVCKIVDFGKFLYQEQKKERRAKHTARTVKSIRLTFSISPHDIEVKAIKCAEFLREGHKVKVEMILRGRERTLQDFAKNKFKLFLEMLRTKQEFKIEQDLKRMPFGFMIVLAK